MDDQRKSAQSAGDILRHFIYGMTLPFPRELSTFMLVSKFLKAVKFLGRKAAGLA
jgi:hypothetical protein